MHGFERAVTFRTALGGRAGGTRHALVRALLISAMMVGIVAMHTFGHMVGHASDETSTAAPRAMSSEHAHQPVPMADHALAQSVRSSAEPADGWASASGTAMCSDPFDVCLAVLIAAGLIMALRKLGRTIDPARLGSGGPTRPSTGPHLRGPPGFGLPIVRLSVLRI
ncbi:hypothetical protein [Actinomadura nitritigenes]|uniref:Uncharacterized protein n=1 Tax=Actinomadura nitritigenes TaxID=134602 RepID=A0ABS3RG22_9ACTN|nr:hypothetical protein [Actinomadura nitritigenes]MBO2444533.1 hypothetical protein [Actinomadura nitritigenes]